MKIKDIFYAIAVVVLCAACNTEKKKEALQETAAFNHFVTQFADIKILRYQIPGFADLSLKEKQLVYYLTQAGLAGRDIMWDQNYRHNLSIRKGLESINQNYKGDRESDAFKSFKTFLKRVWFSNGIHHHYSNDKLKPAFSEAYFTGELLQNSDTELSAEAIAVLFNDADAKKVNKKSGNDNILSSAINFYAPDITDQEVVDFYKTADKGPKGRPIEAGLNSKLVRENGILVEKVWKSGGMYGAAIDQIIGWFRKSKRSCRKRAAGNSFGLVN